MFNYLLFQTVIFILVDHYIKINRTETVKITLEGLRMSENLPMGLFVAEKLFGIILIIIGAIVANSSFNPPTGDISNFSGIFTLIGVIVLVIGIFLIVTKTE